MTKQKDGGPAVELPDWVKDLERKPAKGGPWRKIVTDNGVRWCSLKVGWHGEPWSLAAWRLAQVKRPSKFKARKPVVPKSLGCLNCPPKTKTLSLQSLLAVGFGCVDVRVGKVSVWSGDEPQYTMRRVENLARKYSGLDWTVRFSAPLGDHTYQRQGEGAWILIREGQGFA